MNYEVLVLDLDGTLTNSEKKITEPTKEALLDIQQKGKIVVLASGRRPPASCRLPTNWNQKNMGDMFFLLMEEK